MILTSPSGFVSYVPVGDCPSRPYSVLRDIGPNEAPRPRLLDRVRDAIRARHYSRRTEKAYVYCVQELLGHRDVATTQINTHVLNRGPSGVKSPIDTIFGA